MKIGDLAARTATPVETLRYYEREGLLPAPARTASNYRQYGPAHLERLRRIRRCRALGMSLEEVRALLALVDDPGNPCAEVNALLDRHIAHVAERLAELQALQADLVALRARCAGAADACAIVQELREPSAAAPTAWPRDVHGRGGSF